MARASLKLATFNLYNLQIPETPMYHGKTCSKKQYDAKILWTANMLRQLDADVIGFQELWHPQALEDAFRIAGLDDDYELVTKLFTRSIGTALAVKKIHTIESSEWVKQFPRELVMKKRKSTANSGVPDYKISIDAEYFSRDILKVVIKPEQGAKAVPAISFYVAHLKSKLPMHLDKYESNKPSVSAHKVAIGSALSSIRRIAEAAALRIILNKEMKGNSKPVVLMGDLNDTEHSVSNTLLTGDPNYRLSVGGKSGNSDTGLYSASSLQEYRSLRDVNYTHVFKGRNETLDHILVSEQFYDNSRKRKWSFKELKVLNDFVADDDKATGDHGIVIAEFEYFPA